MDSSTGLESGNQRARQAVGDSHFVSHWGRVSSDFKGYTLFETTKTYLVYSQRQFQSKKCQLRQTR